MPKHCSIEGCEERTVGRGWCKTHYYRWRRTGDPEKLLRPRAISDPAAYFWTKVDKAGAVPAHRPDLGPCWLWTGTVSRKGYGHHGWEGATRITHRIAYQLVVGPIPEGLELDHLCRNRACCNPDHLEAVTHAINALRGISANAINARKTHCLRGHEFTPENTRIDSFGRHCRACRRVRDAEKRALKDRQRKGVA